jgi:hypothetical protein
MTGYKNDPVNLVIKSSEETLPSFASLREAVSI